MVRTCVAAEVIRDSSHSSARRSHTRGSGREWHNFMSPNIADMYQTPKVSAKQQDNSQEEMDIRKLLNDVELLGTSNMTWKERKALQNRKAAALGGKPLKKHRTPLSVAIPAMKNQKKREQKKIEEERILGLFGKRTNTNKKVQKRRPDDRALKASEGHFSRGVLNVKHILEPKPSRGNDSEPMMTSKGKKKWKGKGKGNKGKRKAH